MPGLHRTCHIVGIPSPGPRAMVGSKEEANESQSFAAACYLLVRSQSVSGRQAAPNKFTLGGKTRTRGHYWLVAKASMKQVKGIEADTHTYVPWRI